MGIKRVFREADKDLKKRREVQAKADRRIKMGTRKRRKAASSRASPAFGCFHLDLASNCCEIPQAQSVSAHSSSQNDRDQDYSRIE